MNLLDLPVDLLVDAVLCYLEPKSLGRLCRTSRALNDVVSNSEALWRRMLVQDFDFPVRTTARRSGWKNIYKRCQHGSCYVWGENSNGRLGFDRDNNRMRRAVIQGGITVPTRLEEVPLPLVSLEASGWSYHGISTKGTIVCWGTMNGEQWAPANAPLTFTGIAKKPFELAQAPHMGRISQLQAGRAHVVALNAQGDLFEYRAFGDVKKVQGLPEGKLKSIAAGWDFSAVLTNDNRVCVWWEPPPSPPQDPRIAFNETLRPALADVQVDLVQLPELPRPATTSRSTIGRETIEQIACGAGFVIALTNEASLYYIELGLPPVLPNGLPTRGQTPDESPTMSRAATSHLAGLFSSGRRAWQRMDKFCDLEKLADRPEWDGQPPDATTRITHISAHFQSFAAYSVPASADQESEKSIVLLGQSEWTPESEPVIIPELQRRGVIKVAQGDYHNLALTSPGEVVAWGSYSKGALGLGHPQLFNTPLSAAPTAGTRSTPHQRDSAPPAPNLDPPTLQRIPPQQPARQGPYDDRYPNLIPLPRVISRRNTHVVAPVPPPEEAPPANPGTVQPTQGRQGGGGGWTSLFPGFARSPANAPLPNPPDRVDRPTRVVFPGEELPSSSSSSSSSPHAVASSPEERTKGKFVFALTASGWHSGALAVELDDDEPAVEQRESLQMRSESENDDVDEHAQRDHEMPGTFPPQAAAAPSRGRAGGVFSRARIGFPGRPAMRPGGAGRGDQLR